MRKTKVFKSGNSQAVRLPKEFQMKAETVEIFRRNDEIIIREIPKNLTSALDLFADFSDDFMRDGR
nr:AbrB/MazE/SpoVT family DNA-binding domain-containing protein [Gammaproteobacteria bacterium]